MAQDDDQKIKITFDTNAGAAATETNKLGASIDKVEKSQKGAAKANKGTSDSLEDMGGAIGGTIGAMKSMLKTMWAIVANPLGLIIAAIVGALTLLLKAFTSTNDGADKMEQIMKGLGAVIDVLRDRFLKFAGALGKLFTGDFIGAARDAKAAVSGFGAEVEKEFRQAANAARDLQEVSDAMRDLGVSRAKLNRDLAAAKELITDETASYKDKKKAIDEVRKAEGTQTDQELGNAKKKLAAIQAQNKLSDTSDENLQKAADAQSAVFKLEEEQATNKRAFNKLEKRAQGEEQSRLKGISDANKARTKELADKKKEADKLTLDAQKKIDDELKALAKEKFDVEKELRKFNEDLADKTEEQKLKRQKERASEEIEILKQKGIDISQILISNAEKFATLENELIEKRAVEKAEKQKVIDEKEAADQKVIDEKAIEEEKRIAAEKIAIEQAVADAKNTIQEKQFSVAERGAALIGSLFGKSKVIQKAALIAESAIGIAKTIINTTAANAAAVLKYALLPGGIALAKTESVLNNVSAGIGIAANVAATAKGLQSLGGGGGGSAPSLGNAGGAAPSVQFNNTAENQIGQSVSRTQQAQPPIRVYVAESDISTAQNNVQVLVRTNTFP